MNDLSLYPTASPIQLPPLRTGSAWSWWWGFAWRDEATGEETVMDLAGASARLVIRRRVSDAEPLLTADLTSGLSLDESSGRVLAHVASTTTASLAPCDAAVWELQVQLSGADWWTAFGGSLAILQGVAR